MRTSHKSHYAVTYGRLVEFFARPASIETKRYREPVKVASHWYGTKAAAMVAANKWNQATGVK